MGLLLLRRGQFEAAEPYFRTAIKTLTGRNPNPYDGEPYYNLGWSLKLQGRMEEAFESFYKATWSDAWQHSSFLNLARIATAQKKYTEALALVERSLVRNYHSPAARHLKTVLLRKTSRAAEAFISESLAVDPFNFGVLFESYLLGSNTASLEKMRLLMRDSAQNYLEISLDYAQAGLYTEALRLLDVGDNIESTLVGYYRAWFAHQEGNIEEARLLYKKAATGSPDGVFPNKVEEVLILQTAVELNPSDASAYYYLGNFWYDKRQYPEAIECWEEAIGLDTGFPTTFRNLALAYYNKLGKKEQARQYLERAFALDPSDARVLMELDQLYKISGRPFEERLVSLQKYPVLVSSRDDLYLELVTLHNNLKQYEKARQMLADRTFHPWEGGEGKVVGQYLLCHIELAKQALAKREFQRSIDLLSALRTYPLNLGEGKLYGTQENDIDYLLGCAFEGLGQAEEALSLFKAATIGISQPVQAIYYNDPQPDKIIYQALAWLKLNDPSRAADIFRKFVEFGQLHYNDKITIDYFAVSLPDMLVFDQDINLRNKIHCTYLIGLGYLGQGETAIGRKYLQEVLQMDTNHQGAAIYLQMSNFIIQALKQDAAC
jgi:tetratricopeptide (TPR) repeat protein